MRSGGNHYVCMYQINIRVSREPMKVNGLLFVGPEMLRKYYCSGDAHYASFLREADEFPYTIQ